MTLTFDRLLEKTLTKSLQFERFPSEESLPLVDVVTPSHGDTSDNERIRQTPHEAVTPT